MRIAGRVIDANGNGIPGATLELLDESLYGLGVGAVANSYGYFSFIVEDSLPAYYLKASSIGYKPVLEFTERLTGSVTLTLQKDVIDLPGITVTNSTKKKFPWLLALAGLIVVSKIKR
jgi:hypothetical protein